MQITSTTLRRIIKEEIEAVMNEDRAEHVAGIEAKIKRLEAEVERAQERRDEIGFDPAHENPGLSRTYRELGVRIENMEDKLEVLRQQRAELSMNEEDENVARARKAKHIGPAFDVAQNKFQLDPEYQKGAEAMRKRVAKMKGKMNEDEASADAAEDAAYDNLESCVRTVIKDLLAAGVGADEASHIVFAAVRSTVYRAL